VGLAGVGSCQTPWIVWRQAAGEDHQGEWEVVIADDYYIRWGEGERQQWGLLEAGVARTGAGFEQMSEWESNEPIANAEGMGANRA
jgi:hypothetical protein